MDREHGRPSTAVETYRSRRGRRARRACLAAPALTLAAAGTASGHDFERRLEPVFDGVVPRAGISVDVRLVVAPALSVRNGSGAPLEIVGADGKPFLRIGPREVEANVASPDLYRSNAPAPGAPVPSRARAGATPVWVRVGSEPAWSWFEHRLDAQGARAGDVWAIPARVGGRAVSLRGRWASTVLRGAARTVVTGTRPRIEGVSVEALADGPALLLQNVTGKVLEVEDAHGDPFLRIGPAGAEQRGPAGWAKLGRTPAWAWLEQRAGWSGAEPPGGLADSTSVTTLRRWSIHARLGARRLVISGRVEWAPVSAHHVAAAGRGSRRGLLLAVAGTSTLLVLGGLLLVAGRARAWRTRS